MRVGHKLKVHIEKEVLYMVNLKSFIAAVNHSCGTISFVSPVCDICFASDYIACSHDEKSLVLMDDVGEKFPLTRLSFPADSISSIEQMACTDGCTEYELAIGGGVLTLDIKPKEV